jgi:hypothetical protein
MSSNWLKVIETHGLEDVQMPISPHAFSVSETL